MFKENVNKAKTYLHSKGMKEHAVKKMIRNCQRDIVMIIERTFAEKSMTEESLKPRNIVIYYTSVDVLVDKVFILLLQMILSNLMFMPTETVRQNCDWCYFFLTQVFLLLQARPSTASRTLHDLIPKDKRKLRWFLTPQEAGDILTGKSPFLNKKKKHCYVSSIWNWIRTYILFFL